MRRGYRGGSRRRGGGTQTRWLEESPPSVPPGPPLCFGLVFDERPVGGVGEPSFHLAQSAFLAVPSASLRLWRALPCGSVRFVVIAAWGRALLSLRLPARESRQHRNKRLHPGPPQPMLSPMSRRRRQARNVWLAAPVRPLERQMVGPGLQSGSDQMWRHLTTVGTTTACGTPAGCHRPLSTAQGGRPGLKEGGVHVVYVSRVATWVVVISLGQPDDHPLAASRQQNPIHVPRVLASHARRHPRGLRLVEPP